MVLKLSGSFNGMEIFWQYLQNKPDDNHAIMTDEDIQGMWYCGMVDTKNVSMSDWTHLFDDFQQNDATYLVSREAFLALEKYRYKGEIKIPFDALMINEGKYTDEGLNELFTLSVSPSCCLEPSELHSFLENLKEKYHDEASGLINIRINAKKEIKDLIDEYPSPLRRLELFFDYMIKTKGATGTTTGASSVSGVETTSEGVVQITPEQLAELQSSSFSTKPMGEREIKMQELNRVEKRTPKKTSNIEEKATVALKKVKKSHKGMRG